MLLQVIAGILLLSNRFVPLALALLAPIIVNIVLFHTFMAPQGLPVALFTSIHWLLTFTGVRSASSGLLQVRERAEAEQG
jgi:putative oxidoreductase